MKKIIVIFLTFFLACCDKSTKNISNNPIPYIPVNITVYPNDPLNYNLQFIGGWIYINGGINGIIVYRKSQDEFVALERTSPYLVNNSNASVRVMSDNFTLRDTVSNSGWRIIDGAIIQGPTEWPLKLYSTNYYANSGSLRILN